ncbi:hypothetical protein M3Y97_00848500 [Aphelenchoides bicaudatus]|nr:hypothetical protein M3Y97_00848500 [Aphelenchoides bicaudatus]
MYNRKERRLMQSKLKGRFDVREVQKKYGKNKFENKRRREEQLISSALNYKEYDDAVEPEIKNETASGNTNIATQKKWYKLSIALPGSILNNAQGSELRTYLAGQIARSCAVFCVDEVIVFDETAKITDSQLAAYYNGQWTGETGVSAQNVECNFHLARILEYLECPQYLRKALFPVQKPLKFAGVLNPLDGMHHLRANDLHIKYREGVVIDKPVKKGHGSFCDVGLDKELELDNERVLPPKTRVTLKLHETSTEEKHLRGQLISPASIRQNDGIYWGYTVRIAKSLSDIVSKPYDIVIGTSERGKPIQELDINKDEEHNKVLIIFGGLDGLELALKCDKTIDENNPADLFQYYVNSLPDQGSRIIRTEEAIPITLTGVKMKLDSC